MGRTERSGGIAAFDRLVWQVMTKEPYRSARRVFWIVDNGSDHRGKASIKRLQKRWSNLILVHTPVHASWLNQVEIYHSIIQRKVLAPNDFADTAEVARTLNAFEHHYNQIAQPFAWNFTREKLAELLERASSGEREPQRPARGDRRLIATLLTAGTTKSRKAGAHLLLRIERVARQTSRLQTRNQPASHDVGRARQRSRPL